MSNSKVVWLIPALSRGSTGYPWHPIFQAFVKHFPNTEIFTTRWTGFAPGYEDSFSVSTVGKPLKGKLFKGESAQEYGGGFMPLPLSIFWILLRLQPDVIITKAFSIWSAIALLYKRFSKVRIIIAYEGSSPGVDYATSSWRTTYRQRIARGADAFITNTNAGKTYLTQSLGADPDSVFVRPYEIASPHLLFEGGEPKGLKTAGIQTASKPVFITVGQLIPRKGIDYLLTACQQLKARGLNDYTVLIAGDGDQRSALEARVKAQGLDTQIKFLGWVDYSSLGYYFDAADVFVFPTLADTWGLVTLEAMAIGKPALCSKYAGSHEMVSDGKTGFVFDPKLPETLSDVMSQFILNPTLADELGIRAKQQVSSYTPEQVADALQDVIEFATRPFKPAPSPLEQT